MALSLTEDPAKVDRTTPAITREQTCVAFCDLIAGAADFTATSRRFVHWDQVNEKQTPFLTMLKTGKVRGRQAEGLPFRSQRVYRRSLHHMFPAEKHPVSYMGQAARLSPLQSGYEGSAEEMPPGSPGFDGLTLSHVEGHAAALMRQEGLMEGTLYINNPNICGSCMRLLPTMLPPGAILNVVLPDDTVVQFVGIGP